MFGTGLLDIVHAKQLVLGQRLSGSARWRRRWRLHRLYMESVIYMDNCLAC